MLRIYENLVDTDTSIRPETQAPESCSIVTDDGQPVKRLKKGRYLVLGTGQILRSNDPAAL